MSSFWQHFWSSDNTQVNTPVAVAVILAAPIVALSMVAAIYHIFLLHKGLDGPGVQLLLGLLTTAVTGVASAGASVFSKTTVTQLSSSLFGGVGAPPPAPTPPTPNKAPKMEVR